MAGNGSKSRRRHAGIGLLADVGLGAASDLTDLLAHLGVTAHAGAGRLLADRQARIVHAMTLHRLVLVGYGVLRPIAHAVLGVVLLVLRMLLLCVLLLCVLLRVLVLRHVRLSHATHFVVLVMLTAFMVVVMLALLLEVPLVVTLLVHTVVVSGMLPFVPPIVHPLMHVVHIRGTLHVWGSRHHRLIVLGLHRRVRNDRLHTVLRGCGSKELSHHSNHRLHHGMPLDEHDTHDVGVIARDEHGMITHQNSHGGLRCDLTQFDCFVDDRIPAIVPNPVGLASSPSGIRVPIENGHDSVVAQYAFDSAVCHGSSWERGRRGSTGSSAMRQMREAGVQA